MAKTELLYRILVHDKNGRLVKKTRWRKSKSFVIAFLQHIYVAWADFKTLGVVDTGNVSRVIDSPSEYSQVWFYVNAGDNVSTYGIVVGSGTTPPTNTDHALATQIAHGTGAGQLDYGTHSFTAPAVVGANVDFVVSRSFYNGSGGTVTVNEIGIYCQTAETSTAWYFCIVRDVLAAGVNVPNTQTLTVQYTLRTTV